MNVAPIETNQVTAFLPEPKFKYAPPEREINFAQLVAVGYLPAEAYAAAGFETTALSQKQISSLASRLMLTERVDERIQYYRQLHRAGLNITAERVIQEYAAVAFADPAELFGEDGMTPRNIREVPLAIRRSLSMYSRHADGGFKFQLNSKMGALKALADLHGLFAEADAARAPKIVIDFSQPPSPPPASPLPTPYPADIDVPPGAVVELPEPEPSPLPRPSYLD